MSIAFTAPFAPAKLVRRSGLLMAAIFAVAPLAACSDEGQLVLHTATGDHAFKVEVVDTPESRAKGLMYRQELADDEGMLFDFFDEREVSFWMRNTFIPLDMIFIDNTGVVRTVHVNARPQDPTSIPSQVPVRYVLEIPGGRSAEIGLQPGDTVEHDRIKASPAS